MRYFKCNDLQPSDREMITQYTILTEQKKKGNRQAKILYSLANVLFLILFLSLFVAGFVMLISLTPTPDSPVLRFLFFIGLFLFVIVYLFISIFVAGLISAPIFNKAEKKMTFQKTIIFDKVVMLLRKSYSWSEPCIVTKCYNSSDQRFKNRDVCLFCVGDEIRLTIDLKHGFSIREADLGCYAFSPDEISVDHFQSDHVIITELKSGDTYFHLGRRAKGYIERKAHVEE